MRRIFTYVLAAFMAAFLWILFSAVAASATDAGWSGSNITYDSQIHKEKTADGTNPPGLSKGAKYYLRTEVTDMMSGSGKAYIIYFGDTQAASATSANYVVYNVDSSGKYGSKESGPTQITVTPKALSASSTRAAWNGDNLEFDGKTLTGKDAGPRIADGNTPRGLPSGTQYYQAIGNSDIAGSGKAYIVYFPPGSSVKTETTAKYAVYNVNGDGLGSQDGSSKTIDVTPASASPGGSGSIADDSVSSCSIEGIGWIVCPISNFLAWGMDHIFEMLKGFLVVKPLSTQTDNSLYEAWNYMRNFANIAFVIGFLIIIYSQLTSMGINNYSIKKLLPRLIVAAILVNLSYLVCAIAVDLSNVIGDSLQQVFVQIREGLMGPNTNSVSSWQSVTGFILAGGTAAAAAAVGVGGLIISTGASAGAAIILLLPMLLALIIAILVALVVLAARQAVIVLLIIVSPLAFVAYLLPNTEKWFEKWRSTFITLLVFFPIFAIIFGGSQLAGFLIMQNSDQINIILLGMFVQVAPLVLTPMLVKFSGNIVGKIAGMVNDPSRGILDRTKNWSKTQSDYLAAKNMARTDPVRRRQVFRRFALGNDQMKRAREDRLKSYQARSDARWTNSSEFSSIDQDLRFAQDQKSHGETQSELRYSRSKVTSTPIRQLDIDARNTKLDLDNANVNADVRNWEDNRSPQIVESKLRSRVLKDQVAAIHSTQDAEYEEFKHGTYGRLPATSAITAMMRQSKEDTLRIALNAMRNESAKRAVNETFTQDLEANIRIVDGKVLQNYAGGIQGIEGAQRALASALNAQSRTHQEAITNATTILSHGNFTDTEVREIALGDAGATGVQMTRDMREAAIIKTAGGPNSDEIIELMKNIDIDTSPENLDFRQAFYDALMGNSAARPKWATAGVMGAVRQGDAPQPGQGRIDEWIINAFNANKFNSADTIVDHDKSYMRQLLNVMQTRRSELSDDAVAAFKEQFKLAHTDNRFRGRIGDSKEVLDEIRDTLF